MNDLIVIISSIIGTIGVLFAIFSTFRSRQLSRPNIEFNIGVTHMFTLTGNSPESLDKVNFSKEYKKYKKITTIIFGAGIDENSELTFGCPYLLFNNTKTPIRNLSLVLDYSSKNALKQTEIREGLDEKGKIVKLRLTKDYWQREVRTINSMTQVRYTIDLLRPGERVIIFDPMKFIKSLEGEKTLEEDLTDNKGLIQEFKKINKFCDFCFVDVSIFSESCPPISNRVNLLWFDTNSMEELSSLIDKIVEAFWFGKFPKPGHYIRSIIHVFKKQLLIYEFAELMTMNLSSLQVSKKTRFYYYMDPTDVEVVTAKLFMPPWNYYQLSGNIDSDELIIKATGYKKFL